MSRKAKIIISDTHIGAGGREEGNKLDDFISDADFVAWMHALVSESNNKMIEMELIINGDWIEFLQIPAVDRFEPHRPYETHFYTDPAEGCALQRLEIVYERHPGIFLGLSDFLNADSPRRTVTILFGNHDPELAYATVQARIREMVNARGGDDCLISIGERNYFQDGVFVEHGNAYVETVNQFANPDAPFDPAQPERIERPSGSNFVTDFFNQVEWERPWIDGIHPLASLIFYTIAFDPAFSLRLLPALLTVVPDLLGDIAGAPGSEGEPTSSTQLLAQIEDPVQREQLAQRLADDADFAIAFSQTVHEALEEKGLAPALPPEIAGAPMEIPPEVWAQEITERYWDMLEEVADRIATKNGAKVVAFGHIHERIERQLPSGATYLNTGTWVWKQDMTEATDILWQAMLRQPDNFMFERDLTFARVDISETGEILHAGLGRVGDSPRPLQEPGPQPQTSLWTKSLLGLRNSVRRLFA